MDFIFYYHRFSMQIHAATSRLKKAPIPLLPHFIFPKLIKIVKKESKINNTQIRAATNPQKAGQGARRSGAGIF